MALSEEQGQAAFDEWLEMVNAEATYQAKNYTPSMVKQLAAALGAVSFHMFMQAVDMENDNERYPDASQEGQGRMEGRQGEAGLQDEGSSTEGSEGNLRQEE